VGGGGSRQAVSEGRAGAFRFGGCGGSVSCRPVGGAAGGLEEAFAVVGVAEQAGDLLEAGRPEGSGEAVDRPAVGGGDLVVERLDVAVGLVGGLEADQQVAAGGEEAVELGQHGGDLAGRSVDQRVAGEDTAE